MVTDQGGAIAASLPGEGFDGISAGELRLVIEFHSRPRCCPIHIKSRLCGVLHQAKELVIGGASHLFKNSSTQQVATEIDLTGKLTSPDVSTWQAIMQVLHNAFIEAILPGFDRAVRPDAATDTSRQAHRVG